MTPGWQGWVLLAAGGWSALAALALFGSTRAFALMARHDRLAASSEPSSFEAAAAASTGPAADEPVGRPGAERVRILVVDDDVGFRSLLTATLAGDGFELAEAASVEEARSHVGALRPHVVLLDVALPGVHGLVLCAELQETEHPPKVVLLTGTDVSDKFARSAGADAFLRKPFSPLELLATIECLTGAAEPATAPPPALREPVEEGEQLLVYARDLAHVAEVERAQRRLLETAYRQTVTAFAAALQARDAGTKGHSLRMTRLALELAAHAWPDLLEDPSLTYGLLLHDIGKIGIPDAILLKQGPLDPSERRLVQQHPEIGERILGGVALLQGEGLLVVRSHHERWDGGGYPDGLAGDAIPPGARLCAIADALEALTSDRPYRPAKDWSAAIDEIATSAARHFDPYLVDTLLRREPAVRTIHEEAARAA